MRVVPMPDGSDLGISDALAANLVVGAPKRGPRRFWTTRELAVIKEVWPLGIRAVLEALPGRTASACYAVASRLGYVSATTARTGIVRRAHRFSASADEVIRRRYPEAVTRRGVVDLARELHVSENALKLRALRLGLARLTFKEPPWSDVETEILRRNARYTAHVIVRKLAAAGFHRTATAVAVRAKRLHLDRSDPDRMSLRGCAALLGVECHAVARMIRQGLPAHRRGTDRVPSQGGDEWVIRRADLRRFIADNPTAIDLRKVDSVWFIELLSGRGE